MGGVCSYWGDRAGQLVVAWGSHKPSSSPDLRTLQVSLHHHPPQASEETYPGDIKVEKLEGLQYKQRQGHVDNKQFITNMNTDTVMQTYHFFFYIVITLRQRTCWLTTNMSLFFWWCHNTFLLAKDLHLHCRLLIKLLWSHLSKANGSHVFLSTTKKKGNTFK